MTARTAADSLVRLLNHVSGGTLEATVDGAPLASLDGEARNLTVQIEQLLSEGGSAGSLLKESHLTLWKTRGIPSALARSGWNVTVRDGPDEMFRMGRTASGLTGHVHVSPAALWKLRRLL